MQVTIKTTETGVEKSQADKLLWKVLWRPVNLPRNARQKFKLTGDEVELIALENETVMAALVANWLSDNELEIRHIAVDKPYQRKGIGSSLLSKIFNLAAKSYPVTVQARVRNTTYGFFEKHGFQPLVNEWLEQPYFSKYGITFKLVEKTIEPKQ